MKTYKEWSISAPWAKIAVVSWGSPTGEPVLLVHGRQDSAATFIPLMELLPDKYQYVGVDLPGHGKSGPFPAGVVITRLFFLAAVRIVIDYLDWKEFIYIGHSMGCEQGLFFNVVSPGCIKKFILFDPAPSLRRLQKHDFVEFHKLYYETIYDNYDEYNSVHKEYTYEEAVNAVKRARGFTEEQAKIILSRNLISLGNDKYRLSWDKRLRMPAPQNYPAKYYLELFSKNTPPTLLISATIDPNPILAEKVIVDTLISELQKKCKNFIVETVEGTHDVHVTNPERLAPSVIRFMNQDFASKSKL